MNFFKGDDIEDFYQHNSSKIDYNINNDKSFSHVERYQHDYYTTHFVSIKNIGGNHVGYIVVTYQDHGYADIVFQDLIVYIFITLFFIVSYISLFMCILKIKSAYFYSLKQTN